MDFSSHNPTTSNALNLAARRNDVNAVRSLLQKINPNCVDNRGWTCLHEAADKDNYECLLLILEHPDCRPLAETHEGHTALYIACRKKRSIKTIKALLDSVPDIANYGSNESVTPLHIASGQGRTFLIQLLLDYGALINVQDFDGDTPLHDAAMKSEREAVEVLLHAGADPEIKNDPNLFTPFHLACGHGCIDTVKTMFPYVTDINMLSAAGESPLMVAVRGASEEVVSFLLENKADLLIRNVENQSALDMSLALGYIPVFKMLLSATPKQHISSNIMLYACKPHYFKTEILEALLYHNDLGPEFFDFIESFHVTLETIGNLEPFYLTNAPLNSYLNICEYIYNQSPEKFREFFYLFLSRGVSVDAIDINECPPLVYIHYSGHTNSFPEVFKILREHDCNVDYCSARTCTDKDNCVPDAFIASLTSDAETAPYMLPYSLHCDPATLLKFAFDNGIGNRLSLQLQAKIISMIDESYEGVFAEHISNLVPSLRHICRLKIRSILRNRKGGVKSTKEFFVILDNLPLPPLVKNYLRYAN
ncbi:ankyrin repeat and SOCS box protein 3-like [Amyelois transitella]|uniref:ankyrin repeat and SOCS box protein 3-like n=1 Tax=Amyelois transitella TaxID=680683 RepID=UPI0029903B91|nr:ankyrin repeat and SOCS box protein 3-like [Amyelois transitella]XP_060804006.1 ankyrin repeat and SOCS box protein 3-like [Amyelois transitella]